MNYAAMDIAKQISKRSNNTANEEFDRLRSGIIQWVQQMPDRLVSAGYTDKNINVFIANHSPQVNTWGWSSGSAFERSFEFGEVICKMTGYNKEIFDSRMPEGLLTIVNAGVDKRGKQQMHERMNDEGADRYSNLLVQYVNDPDKDIKYTQLKQKPTEMQFQQMFMLYVKLKCSAYGFDYTELNIEDGKSGGLGGSGAHEKRIEQQSAAGIRSDSKYYAHCLTEALISPWSKDYKMEFIHDSAETKEEVELRTSKMAYKSLFETRIEENLEEEWWKEAPKEFREDLKRYGQFSYIPGMTDTVRGQLIQKVMDQDLQKEMAEQEQQQEEETPPKQLAEPQESKEISDLKSAIGQEEKATEELEKSFAVTVDHRYS